MKKRSKGNSLIIWLAMLSAAITVSGQTTVSREFALPAGGTVEIINHAGKVVAAAEKPAPDDPITEIPAEGKVSVTATANRPLAEAELKIDSAKGKVRIEVAAATGLRVDLRVDLPARSRVRIETLDGAVFVSGDLEKIDVKTETGTIAADVPTDDLKYEFQWTASRPRVVSDIALEEIKERSAGRFSVKGRVEPTNETESAPEPASIPEPVAEPTPAGDQLAQSATDPPKEKKKKARRPTTTIDLNFTTARGIVLLNVPPNEVASDLRERPLTNAAKAIIRSGDSLLMEAIRRASPKYFGDYAKTLPPAKREPAFSEKQAAPVNPSGEVKQLLVSVTDGGNRAVPDLKISDFEVTENNAPREVLAMQPVTAPFNLVLLLDVSGSVDNYVNFIRKAARNFVNTVGPEDRISIVLFNEDTQVLSRFTQDKAKLSEELDTFDAGGGTAFYDALAYTLADTLRPLKGERTAIVVLTDGDDNRSFLAFDSLAGSIQESGALIYPLYVPSGLIAAAESNPNTAIDPLRVRYMGLTSKAEGEGEKLAAISGGRYYPITQLSQIQEAYDDIVKQLRTAYSLTFRSTVSAGGAGVSPRLRVKVKRENAFVKLGSVSTVSTR